MLKLNNIQRKKAVQLFNRTEEEFKEDIGTINKWLKSQQHLPDIKMSDIQIGNFLLMNKCSIEKSKQKIDAYFTFRKLLPEFFENFDPQLPSLKEYRQLNISLVLPDLTDTLYRVMFMKQSIPNIFNPILSIKQLLHFGELRIRQDCWVGEIAIFDMGNITLAEMTKLSPTILAKGIAAYQKIYSFRLKAGYVINCKPYYIQMYTIAKAVVKAKILDRIKFDVGTDSLKEILPLNQIPKDYGGEGPSLKELNELLELEFDKHEDVFHGLNKMEVNESLRPEKLDNDEILGFYGNFKKLNVD